MSKFGQPPFVFVIKRDNQFLSVKNNEIVWIDQKELANKYASKYAAKDHLRRLTNVPDRIEFEQIQEK